ncbi:MAG: methylamine utilization protein [Sphingomonas sp. 28-66-16]|nr:MAG: methylamine utilization protein [Sphingomonas sp. 28-66-16]
MLVRVLSLSLLVLPAAALAAPVDITVRTSDGKPLVDAVVLIDTPRASGPPQFDWAYEMAQQNISFVPHVLIVPVGTKVPFPNRDKVRHHVYSASKPKKFDIKLYGKDETRSIVFDKPGAVALGCNIHDQMSGFIYVTDTPYAMRTDAAGHIRIANVPAGAATIRIWHPSLRLPGNEAAQAVSIPASGLSTSYTMKGS